MHVRRIGFLLAVIAACLPARAQGYTYGPWGLNLRWDQCYGAGGVQNRAFACDTNAGSNVLIGSVVPAWDIVNVGAIYLTVDLAAASSTHPAWWQFPFSGGCRPFSVMTLSSAKTDPHTGLCPEWNGGLDHPNLPSQQIGTHGANTARLVLVVNAADANLATLRGRTEYFAFRLTISNSKTVGSGACGGCETPVCIALTSADLSVQRIPHSLSRFLTGPANQVDSDFVTWQGGGAPVVGGVVGCPAATPAKQPTWGAVKSLYR